MKHLLHLAALALTLCVPLRALPLAQETLATATPPELTMLRLYGGDILWASVVGHDAQTLHIERLDNHGKLKLPWASLDPSLADELLEKYGYVDHSGDEVIVEADRLLLSDGTEVIGMIVGRTENELWIKTAQSTFPVPKLKVRGSATRIQVPALDVYTREELYQQESVKLDPTSAQSLWDLSIFCERIYDFAHAVEHLQAIGALAGEPFKPSEVATAIARNQIKVANQAQLDALREIDYDRVRGYFDRALAKIEAFTAQFPKSTYLPDAAKKKAQVVKAREAKLRERVVELWHSWLGRLVAAKAREPQLTLEAAIAWVDEGIAKDLVDAVAKEVQKTVSAEMTPDLVTRYWKEREGGKWRRASYGQGTFLLGDSEARKGLVKEEAPKNPESETENARKQLEERISRYLQNQEMIKKAKTSPDEENELETFWREYSGFSKTQWILAYFVEHSGNFQLREPQFSNCPDCGGKGKREILNAVGGQTSNSGGRSSGGQGTGPSTLLADCPMCHGIGVFRRVMYR